ncbi:MAG: Uma2 family endonuclease [Spirosomataceae bacterium]
MGEVAIKKNHYSVAEYLELERNASYKSEYYNGEIFAMAGGTPVHSLISSNVIRAMGNSLIKAKKPCFTYSSDLQIALSKTNYVYPDASVICGAVEHYEGNSVAAKNPTLVIEVMSPESTAYDRGEKFEKYRQIDTLREYVLITQHRPLVEVYFKPENSRFWQYTPYNSLTDTIVLSSIEVTISMEDLYLGVVFPPLPQD